MIIYQPKKIIFEGPCNDVRNGVLQAVIEANINSLISQLEAGIPGVEIYFTEVIPEDTGLNFAPVNAFLATKPNYIPFPAFVNATMLNPDLVHVNEIGTPYLAGVIQAATT